MKHNQSRIFLLTLLGFNSYAFYGWTWEGPPAPIGSGLVNLNRPTTYLESTGSGFSSVPLDGRLRGNLVLLESKEDTYQVNFKTELFQLPYSIPLSGSGVNTPTNLWAIDVGGSYRHKVNDSHDYGLILGIGSDSDIPFNSVNEIDYSVTATYHWKKDILHSWLFLLNYSATRSFAPGVPLPGLGYFIMDPENHTQVFYGLPFFFGWEFAKDWQLTANYFLLTTMNTEVNYRLNDKFKIHGGFQWGSQTWLRAWRSDSRNHIIFDQKKIFAGLASSIGENWFLDISTGFVFDERIAEAYSILSQNINYNYLPVSITAQGQLAYKF